MSLRSMQDSRGGFSSLSMGSFPRARPPLPHHPAGGSYFGFADRSLMGVPIKAVSVNQRLLAPLDLKMDPTIHAVRTQEKEEIKILNNRFGSFIEKVRLLEQQNKMLETKWRLLQGQGQQDSSVEPMLKAYISSLQSQLSATQRDQQELEAELRNIHRQVEEGKQRYEDEILKRNEAENEFVLLKKDVDIAYLQKADQEEKVTGLLEDLSFQKALYDEELRELGEQVADTTVVVQMDNSRQLDMEHIVEDVRNQYEVVSARGRQETEAWYKNKIDLISSQADQRDADLRRSKAEISDLKRLIACIRSDITSARSQREALEAQIVEVEEHGTQAAREAQLHLKDLEEALQKAKHNMARQVREYQELMNVKLALDIEIATYRRLLEGEEHRIGQDSIISVTSVPSQSYRQPQPQVEPKPYAPRVLVKMIETQDSFTLKE